MDAMNHPTTIGSSSNLLSSSRFPASANELVTSALPFTTLVMAKRARAAKSPHCYSGGILIASGLVVQNVHVFGQKIELGLLSIPFTMFWLLGAINALNLIDGLDGLAAGAVQVVDELDDGLLCHVLFSCLSGGAS